MALPAIAPYSMPGAAELPRNKLAWTPEPKRCVLLIHDMQRYFVDAFTQGQSPVTELVANIQRLRDHAVKLGIPVVYSAQPGDQTAEQRGLQLEFWGPGVRAGPKQQIIDELTPAQDDTVLTKWRYSAFRNTRLMDLMREQGRDQLIICGIYAHIGCLQTASDGSMSEIRPFLVADAVADFSLEKHQMALEYASKLVAFVTTTQQLMDAMPVQAAGAAVDREQLRADVAELLMESASAIGEDENLLERGMDSIRLMSLVERWRQGGTEVSFVELAEKPTLTDWYALLAAKQPVAMASGARAS
ncbi:isochorismatase family protein [Corallococcus exiguus]|uniref:isochorismatase family protein n=1 Tax=Corallococcus TaxID=83461 RepID=UPI000EDCA440|nr:MULTISPECIES: isochorismatase family protein [Corallococcus]NNB85306.1 isochorismatase family protein [Corallococcus exiguus]NNB93109.1 isochorismatase family protein [Corallococcus exiguus]NNC01580.1 isochorismatase family protein [Corallococcus exiguus]NPC45739.1 isochorismatase family protein [Corallococcus exiguus]RKH82045.1 isochorismatase family protein [Corallococcus sp. AB032C]